MSLSKQCKLLIVSTSTVYGKPYLTYLNNEIPDFFKGIQEIVFIPFARPDGITWDTYTRIAGNYFKSIGIELKGLHEFPDMKEALDKAQGIFTGGGNTFLLLNTLYEFGLIEPLKKVINDGIPYMGTSAGSNILGQTIGTTNDMPIVYPPSFDALQIVPFNINPHYLDPHPDSTHMGETRETRIKEFLVFNDMTVAGIREGGYLKVEKGTIHYLGNRPLRIFRKGEIPFELLPNDDVSFLIK